MTTDRANRQQLRSRRNEQESSLREKESDLRALAKQQDKQRFFDQITSLLGPLKRYIKRRLIIAYANGDIRTPLFTSSDLLDEVVLQAFENYEQKPQRLTLEQWLYRIANQILKDYIEERKAEGRRRESFERLREKELRTLEELPQLTADVEGEPWLAEDLDDAEWDSREFIPPAYIPPEPLPQSRQERRSDLRRIVRVLGQLPEDERAVAELYLVEGFSKEEVANICDATPEEVERIAEKVRRDLQPERSAQRKAS